MPKGKGGPNAKQVAGRAKKAETEDRKKAQEAAKAEAAANAEWQKGANDRKAAREQEAAGKADEAARKRQEKAALLAAEEAELGSGGKVSKASGIAKKNVKKKKKNDLALLEDALVSSADKKAKKKKEEALRKAQQEEEARKKKAEAEAALVSDPLLANTAKMIGGEDEMIGRKANLARMQDEGASGIDAALGHLNVADAAKSSKALYKEFEARMLPQIKEEFPGLRMTQQKEKIWNLWKKSPENPMNQT